MSYDVCLIDSKSKKLATVEKHEEGATYVIGGTNEAELNITYNYYKHFREHLGTNGIYWLNKKKASKTIEKLEKAVTSLGTKQADDYWEDTKGNAGYALNILLGWAKQHPNAVFEVS